MKAHLILLAGGDLGSRERRSQELREAGFAVQTALDGSAAYLKIPPDKTVLVIIDLAISRWNGMEIVRQIKAIAPQVPVLALAPLADRGTVNKVGRAGADEVLHRSCSVEQLTSALGRLLSVEKPDHVVRYPTRLAAEW